jgi:hypothetical protein
MFYNPSAESLLVILQITLTVVELYKAVQPRRKE